MWETVDFGFIPNFFLRLSIDWSAEKTNKQTNECDPVPGDHSGEEALRLRSGTADLAGQTLAGSLRQSNDILHRWSFINVHSFLILRFVRSFLHDRVLTGAVRVVCVCVCVCVCVWIRHSFVSSIEGNCIEGKEWSDGTHWDGRARPCSRNTWTAGRRRRNGARTCPTASTSSSTKGNTAPARTSSVKTYQNPVKPRKTQ